MRVKRQREVFGIEDLASSKELEKLVKVLTQLTSLVVALRYPNGKLCKLYTSEFELNPLCRIIRECPEGLAACTKSDILNCNRATQQKHGLRYYCHAGLIDFVMPVYVEGKHIATLNCGQLLPEPPSEKGFKMLKQNIGDISVNKKDLRKAYFGSNYLEPEKLEVVFDALSFFANYICEIGRGLGSAHWNHKHPEIIEARKYLKDNFHNPITLNSVAEHVGLSETYLSRLFVRVTGINFTNYLNLLRLAEAKQLLENTEWTIAKIAFEVGYGSLPYFNHIFKKQEKCSPREYRKNNKSPKENNHFGSWND